MSTDATATAASGALTRLAAAPLWAHTLALSLILLGVLAVTVPGYSYFSDEGAAIIQQRQLRAGEGWIYDYPFAEADPTGEIRPFINGQESPQGVAPYAKHPLFVGVLAVAEGTLGIAGLVLVAVAGTVAAAAGAALLARRIDSRLAVPSLWVVGLASPLFFDAYLVLAHTIAAATAVYAVLLTLVIIERKPAPAWMYALLAIATAATVLLRSEGLVLVPAIVAGAGVIAWRDPDRRTRALWAAGVVGLAGVAAFAGERAYIASIVGDASAGSRIVTENWLIGRFLGLFRTWFPATYTYDTAIEVMTGLVPVIIAFAAIRTRRTRNAGLLIGAFVITAVLFLLRFALAEPGPIPGLAVAFPIGWAGLLLLRRRYFASMAMRFVGIVGLVMVLGVLLTQFSRGGGVEWGGRYFAVALPVVTAVLLRPFLDLTWESPGSRRRALVAVTAVTVALMAIGIQTLRANHIVHRDGAATIAAAAEANSQAPGEPAVVVMTTRLGPQIVWNIFRDYDFLSPARDNVDRAREVLEAEGRTHAVVPDGRGIGGPDWPDWTVVDTRWVEHSFPVYSVARS